VGILDGWRLCPRCGGELIRDEAGHASCPVCGSRYWANSAPAAEGLFERDGKVLLARRKVQPRRGFWDIPGGFLEEGEDAIAGLKRELREETGIEVEPIEFVGPHVEAYDGYFVLGLTWLVRGDGEPRPADDVGELRWFGPGELPAEMAFPHQDELLRRWAEHHR
jgi:ADP-ribose pyrophosphatase YjhB (NUDIX family)